LKYPDADAPLAHALARWSATIAPAGDTCLTIALERHWLATPDCVSLEARYTFRREPWGVALSAELDGATIDLDAPIELLTVDIAKPWGREIWFTGIEARGECAVRTPTGPLPLSKYLALAPGHLLRGQPLLLLKILDPKPEPVTGDLYFEVHREKQEVYVVTHVDRTAWSDGIGGIRFGMNQALRAEFADDDAFRAAYLLAVADYERIRRHIDGATTAPPGAAAHAGASAADVAIAQEPAARAAMERFTALRPLTAGDVVVVPTWLPHSLLHGVRVVEFQTPTYERYILSFAQQVLTQSHWDTAYAVPRMTLDAPAAVDFAAIAPGVEQIVRFNDLHVWRVTLAPQQSFDLPAHPAYALCMTVNGSVQIGALALGPERAAFVPGATLADAARRRALASVYNAGNVSATFLIAAPDL